MQTEILLKDYSELSLHQRIIFCGSLPKLFQAYEESFQHLQESADKATTETERNMYLPMAEVMAQLMAYYNSNELKDYRAFSKSFEYLQSVLNNSKAPIAKKFVAEKLFESMKEVATDLDIISDVIVIGV